MSFHLALVLCLIVVAWLSAAAMAVRSASRIWLRHWAERRLRGATSVLLYLERPQRLLAAAVAGNAIVLGIAGIIIGWHSHRRQDIAVTELVVYTIAVVFIGQLFPRTIARRFPAALIPVCMPVLRVFDLATRPLLWPARRKSADAADALADGGPAHEVMQDLLREGELEGVGRQEEIAIISGVMEFGSKVVRDVMTPRAEVFALPEGLDPRAVAARIAESAFSRVPVYKGSLEQVLGIYHAFDVLKARAEELPPLRPVAYTPADTSCSELLFRMLRARLHLAVVHDDHGHTLGIVTLENLLEELVGDIRDEHDEPATVAAAPNLARA
ncbi:MAG TPA: CNNM domain-containing protein [Gemmatimonadaceae bacterium]|nr:CNNM domain-containing protein [Gemmatimonadaceae bacterium]